MANITSILDKIKKLRALAGNNPCEEEVKSALAMIDKLVMQYRIDAATLEESNNTPDTSDPLVRKTIPNGDLKNRSSWRESILGALCNSYGACWYYGKANGIEYTICARQSDFDILSYLYTYLCEEGLRLSKQNNPFTVVRKATSAVEILAAIQSGGVSENSNGLSWGKSYLEGFGQGIRAQLDTAHKAQLVANTSSAMVLLDNRGKEARTFMRSQVKLGSGTSLAGSHSNAGARNAGYAAGLRTNMSRGLGGGGSRGQLGS